MKTNILKTLALFCLAIIFHTTVKAQGCYCNYSIENKTNCTFTGVQSYNDESGEKSYEFTINPGTNVLAAPGCIDGNKASGISINGTRMETPFYCQTNPSKCVEFSIKGPAACGNKSYTILWNGSATEELPCSNMVHHAEIR